MSIENGKIWWVNKGGSSFRINNHIIPPNMKFQAVPGEISEAFRDIIQPLENIPVEDELILDGEKPVYTLVQSKRPGKWNILDSKGKKLNETPLEKETAEQLIIDLEK